MCSQMELGRTVSTVDRQVEGAPALPNPKVLQKSGREGHKCPRCAFFGRKFRVI